MGVLPDRVIQCPNCSTRLRLPVINETIGMTPARRWVDGYTQYPLVTEPPVFSVCPECSNPFWTADAPVVGTFSFTSESGSDLQWESLPYVPDPSYGSIFRAISGGAAARKPIGHEIYLRLLGMQKYNHGRRSDIHYTIACKTIPPEGTEVSTDSIPPDVEENYETLVSLLSAEKGLEFEDSRGYFLLMCAEVYREMGRFPSSLQALDAASREAPMGKHADAVKSLSSSKRAGIYLL